MESHINFHEMNIDDRILKVGIIHLTNIIFPVYFYRWIYFKSIPNLQK